MLWPVRVYDRTDAGYAAMPQPTRLILFVSCFFSVFKRSKALLEL